MKFIDFFFLTVIASTAAGAFYLEMFPLSIFFTLFFFIVLSSVVLHYVTYPLPRYLLGASILPVSEDEVKDLEDIRNKKKGE